MSVLQGHVQNRPEGCGLLIPRGNIELFNEIRGQPYLSREMDRLAELFGNQIFTSGQLLYSVGRTTKIYYPADACCEVEPFFAAGVGLITALTTIRICRYYEAARHVDNGILFTIEIKRVGCRRFHEFNPPARNSPPL